MLYHSTTYTVESVTSGHPDKICDQISDAILDECLAQDLASRVGIETFGSHGMLVIGGEITSKAVFNAKDIAKRVYREIGYEDDLEIILRIVHQSPDIAQGVDTGGAGDQGIMYGYATDETAEFLPFAIVKVHMLAQGLERLRKEEPPFSWLGPDGKTQITLENGKIKTVLVSCQHAQEVGREFIEKELTRHLIGPVLGELADTQVLVNPTGKFVQGGFAADTGLTGRKIMVDTYGGIIPHGGGCFSGKDPTKLDRSGAYMARFVAKNIVANGYAKECLVSVAYAIGRAEPLMLEAFNEKGEDISRLVQEKFDFRPQAIIERLLLCQPMYQQTAVYGHFGRAGKHNFPWEQIISF